MGRIQEAYGTKFRTLLGRVHARRATEGISWLNRRAEQLREPTDPSSGRGFERVYRKLSEQVERFAQRRGVAPSHVQDPHFLCDAGLGGLARWLRAAGYDAHWIPDISDEDVLREARERSAILLTTDSGLMQRRVVRDRVIPTVWVSPSLKIREQLVHVLAELRLAMREPRCMSCGGELEEVRKEEVAGEIPPRTLRWLDEYFRCQKCGKLFWHGTHWKRIREKLGGTYDLRLTRREGRPR